MKAQEKEPQIKQAMQISKTRVQRWLTCPAVLIKRVKQIWKTIQPDLLTFFIIILIVSFVAVMLSDPVQVWVGRLLGTENKNATLAFLGLGIGGLVLWQKARSAEKHAEATETGNTQERLKNAIEHLGNDKTSARIGAAYELYHLAKDNKNYRKTVCDILCGHIRQKTQKRQKEKPSEEIKTFLNLLCGKDKGEPFSQCQIDLSSSFLQGVDLSGAQLQGADLSEAQLQGANLSGAELQGAYLSEAQLQRALLLMAELQGANLSGAELQGADLSGAELQGADLSGAELQGADLSGAQLQGIGSSKPFNSFQNRILARAGKESDFTNVIFSGGLNADQVKTIIASMPDSMDDKKKKEMEKKLNEHVGKAAGNTLSGNSGAIAGTYSKDESEKWIAGYEKFIKPSAHGE